MPTTLSESHRAKTRRANRACFLPDYEGAILVALGVVRLQNRQIEYELKVRQKERVPSRFDTRLWLCGLHGRVQI
jgi:hypothetical protein